MKVTRRKFLKQTTAAGAGLGLYGFLNTFGGYEKMRDTKSKGDCERCIVLGMDGLDPQILAGLIKENNLPNFTSLANEGTFVPLSTSNPVMSPVAWSNIASGAGPEHHGIFDFLSRDPTNYMPYLSLRKSSTSIFGTRYKNARQCSGFWRYISDAGIPTTVIRWPVTFPAERVTGRFLSGLGVPDLLGSEGQYRYYTTEVVSKNDPSPDNVVHVIWGEKRIVRTYLQGPMTGRNRHAQLPMVIKMENPDRVAIGLTDVPLIKANRGRWTKWIKIAFKVGIQRIHGMVRFLLLDSDPHLKLFVYPINIDPADQAFSITYPPDYGQQLEDNMGTFHTLGMPVMVHPFSHKRYGFPEFLSQVDTISGERTKMFLNELDRFDNGLLAFVFDHTDRLQHALWATRDPHHPVYNQEEAKQYRNVINEMYRQMDNILGRAIEKADNKTALFVVSDHGFAGFRRQVHLNRWLIENGYMHLKESDDREASGLFQDVDWQKTRAYAMGFASIYINLAGREGGGIVKRGDEYDQLCREIPAKLEPLKDPDNGSPVVHKIYRGSKVYNGGPLMDKAPDLLAGLMPGYRFSWQTALGAAPTKLIEDNTSRWSGDHIFDPTFMAGILLCNRKINTKNPRGIDIAPTVLNCLGLNQPDHMTGKSLSST